MNVRSVQADYEKQRITNLDLEYGDLLIRYLEKEGVKYVFGIPGGALEPLYNAMARSEARGGLKPVLAKHEQGAAYMADGYARVSGHLGVCCATTGPGATNLFAGVASAYADSVPVLALTAQIPVCNFGKGAVQDSTFEGVDVVEIFRKITRYSAMVISPKMAENMFRKAIRAALSDRRGPVHLSLPSDVISSRVSSRFPSASKGNTQSYLPARYFDGEGVEVAASLLSGARRPAILAGAGSVSSDAAKEIVELADLLVVPTATTPKAKGVFPEDHDLALGCFGFAGSPRAQAYLLGEEIDVLLAIGTSFNEMATNAWTSSLGRDRIIIQIDIDPLQFGKNYPCTLPLQGDAKVVLRHLLNIIKQYNLAMTEKRIAKEYGFADFCRNRPLIRDPEKMESDAIPLKPQRLMADIRRAVPDETIFFVDIGNNMAWAIHYLQITRPGTFFAGFGFASMGHGVAASIGGKMAAPDRPVVAIVGDGGFQMNGMEVATAVNHNVPVIWIILNDSGLGMVRHGQRMSRKAIEVCNTYQRVNFVKIAEGLGARGVRITRPGELNRKLMDELINSGRPTVIDVHIDAEEPPPIGSRIKSLGDVYIED